MGKTFVEDERPCDSCVNVTRYGCVSWNCEYINRDEAIKAWREKHETADRKTENSSEKPNNCEPQTYITEDRDTQILDAWQVHHRNTTSVEDEPQMAEDIVRSFGFKVESYRQAKAKDEPQTDCAWK